MKNFLLELLLLETTSDKPENLISAIDLVDNQLQELGLEIRKYSKNGKPSLVVTSDNSKSPEIFLSGHIDVVPGSPEQFKPFEVDGKIYARGASDMKGPVSSMVFAFKELVTESVLGNTSVGLMLTSDEEIGGLNGTEYLLKQEGYSSKIAFIPDTTSEIPYEICTDEKAVWHTKITVDGLEAHGSRPWLGKNAIEKAIDLFRAIKEEFYTKWGEPTSDHNWIPTLSLGKIVGGSATNKVPECAELYLDIRFPASINAAFVKDIVLNIASKYHATVETLVSGSPNHIEKDNPYLLKWISVVEATTSLPAKFFRTHGGSDGRFFCEKEISCIMSKPCCSLTHMKDEWADYESLVEFKDAIKNWVLAI